MVFAPGVVAGSCDLLLTRGFLGPRGVTCPRGAGRSVRSGVEHGGGFPPGHWGATASTEREPDGSEGKAKSILVKHANNATNTQADVRAFVSFIFASLFCPSAA